MATTLGFKDIIDQPLWRPASPLPVATAAGGCIVYDKRNNIRNAPLNYYLSSATGLQAYSPYNDEWLTLASPALTGTFGAGANAVFHPTQGPRGTLAAGATTTVVTLSTALPAAVGVNQLANAGAGSGFYVTIIGNAAGSSGKTETRRVIANTAGTTPQLVLDSALSFTPVLGDAYEFRSGRVFMLSAGTLAAGMWKYYDCLTNSFSGNLTTTNLPATVGGDSQLVALSEGHIPASANVGEGFLGVITATASSSTTITASDLSAALTANEYRNFQVRITEDTTTPTAAGQRRRISSHTSGATAVFTVAAFAVTPSATAKFVIENDDDKIVLFTNQTAVYNYNITANTWDTTTWAAAAAAGSTGLVCEQSFAIDVDPAVRNARHSFIYRVRGGNVNTIDVFDIAGAATGAWTANIDYGKKATTFTAGTCGAYDSVTNSGRWLYLQVNGTQRFMRFDMLTRNLEPWANLRYPQGTATVGAKMHMAFFFDGATRLGFLFSARQTGTEQFAIALQR